jgi:hypothetical protein
MEGEGRGGGERLDRIGAGEDFFADDCVDTPIAVDDLGYTKSTATDISEIASSSESP